MHKVKGFRENIASVIVTIFLILFADKLLLVDVFSQLYY